MHRENFLKQGEKCQSVRSAVVQEKPGCLENALYAMARVMWAPDAHRAMAEGTVFWASAKPATAPAWFFKYAYDIRKKKNDTELCPR